MPKKHSTYHLHDKRIIDRNIQKGLLTREDFEAHIAGLPDIESEAVVIDLEAAEAAEAAKAAERQAEREAAAAAERQAEAAAFAAPAPSYGGQSTYGTTTNGVTSEATDSVSNGHSTFGAADTSVTPAPQMMVDRTPITPVSAPPPPIAEDIPNVGNPTPIIDIEGIGPVYSERLNQFGIKTVGQLLHVGAQPAGRTKIAEKTEIASALVLRWVNMADLFRIRGVGEEYSDLLEASGVDTVVELAQRNAANLTAKMNEVNLEKALVRVLPSESVVTGWVEQAKTMERGVFY